MARLPLMTTGQDVTPEALTVFDSAMEMGQERFMNQFRALGHHPPLAKAVLGLMQACYTESVLEQKYVELGVLMVSTLNRCNYCVVHHTPPALTNGISASQLASIEDGSWCDGNLFDPVERAVLLFAEQMNARKGRVDDSLFATLEETFSSAQLVELTVRIGLCEFYNRFNEALQLDIEPVAANLYAQAESA